jgi:uncharacterized protein with HEPN domain
MSSREKKYLFDIQNAISEIENFMDSERYFQKYKENKMLKSAVERQLTIIGEAMNRLLAINPEITISSSRQIVQFRNKITHEYDGVDDEVVWAIIIKYLPQLKADVEKYLESPQ